MVVVDFTVSVFFVFAELSGRKTPGSFPPASQFSEYKESGSRELKYIFLL